MRRALLFPLVALVSVSLGGLTGVPRIIQTDTDGGMECRPAVGEEATCAMSCGACPMAESACGSEGADATAAASHESGPSNLDSADDGGSCICCICGIGVPASAPELVMPGERSVEDARPVRLLTSVDRQPTSPPPEAAPFVS